LQAFQHDPLFIFLNDDRAQAGQSVSDYASSAVKCAKDGEFLATSQFEAVAWCYFIPEQLPLESDEQHKPVFPQMEEIFHDLQNKFYKVGSLSMPCFGHMMPFAKL